MKKLWIILPLIFFTGCAANITINIDSSHLENIIELSETRETLEEMSEDTNAEDTVDPTIIQEGYAYSIAVFERDSNIERKLLQRDNEYIYQYNQKLSYKNYSDQSLIYDCYDTININNDDTIKIETSEEFTCFDKYSYLDSVVLKINSSYDIIETNADVWGDHEYVWYINKNDINKPIYLELTKPQTKLNVDIIMFTVITLLIIIGIIFYYKKYYKRGY